MAFSADTSRALTAIAVAKQREGRVPGLVAAVGRKGALEFFSGVGAADLDRPDEAPTADTSYPIASNTKTFVAVVVMALRDEGRLSLDDPIGKHVPGTTHENVTVRQLLSHSSGMQREPVGDVWDTLRFPTREELVPGWNEADRVQRPHTHLHYSNLGYSMLGEMVQQLEGEGWYDVVRRRLLVPLGMSRTTVGPVAPRAKGYYVPPFSDVARPEPDLDAGALGPAAALASTAADMLRWGGFVANPDRAILDPTTMEEMCQLQQLDDAPAWTHGYGLGWHLFRKDDRTWVGHTGGWPGSITGVFTHRESATTALVFMNQSAPTSPVLAALELGGCAITREPVAEEPWRPGTEVPADLEPLLGHWYSEGGSFVFSVREGALEARVLGQPSSTPPSVFERVSDDVHRTVSGRERGELLRVNRGDDGAITHLNWATYRFTREPYAFGEWLHKD